MDEKTIEYYNNNAEEYYKTTIGLNIEEKYEDFIKDLPKGAKILDAGCGSGRDLIGFKNLGFEVVGLDASVELAKIAEKNSGVKVYNKSFAEIDFNNEFDAIWCMASLLHLNKKDMNEVLIKLSNALKENGKLYASFKTGEGESYDSKNRFFSYMKVDEIKEIFKNTERFKNIQVGLAKDKLGREDTQWINLITYNEKPKPKINKINKFKI